MSTEPLWPGLVKIDPPDEPDRGAWYLEQRGATGWLMWDWSTRHRQWNYVGPIVSLDSDTVIEEEGMAWGAAVHSARPVTTYVAITPTGLTLSLRDRPVTVVVRGVHDDDDDDDPLETLLADVRGNSPSSRTAATPANRKFGASASIVNSPHRPGSDEWKQDQLRYLDRAQDQAWASGQMTADTHAQQKIAAADVVREAGKDPTVPLLGPARPATFKEKDDPTAILERAEVEAAAEEAAEEWMRKLRAAMPQIKVAFQGFSSGMRTLADQTRLVADRLNQMGRSLHDPPRVVHPLGSADWYQQLIDKMHGNDPWPKHYLASDEPWHMEPPGQRPVYRVASGGACAPTHPDYTFFRLVGGRAHSKGTRSRGTWLDEPSAKWVDLGPVGPKAAKFGPNRSLFAVPLEAQAMAHQGIPLPNPPFRREPAVAFGTVTVQAGAVYQVHNNTSWQLRSLPDPRTTNLDRLRAATPGRYSPPQPRGRRWGPPT